MNGVEALIAMQKGATVQDDYGRIYAINERGFVCTRVPGKPDKWLDGTVGLNAWMKGSYYDASFTLTFFEAMIEAEKGHKVRNEGSEITYHMEEGVLYNFLGEAACLTSSEMGSKWRVETEESE